MTEQGRLDQWDALPCSLEGAGACGQNVPDPVTFGTVRKGDEVAVVGREGDDWRPVVAADVRPRCTTIATGESRRPAKIRTIGLVMRRLKRASRFETVSDFGDMRGTTRQMNSDSSPSGSEVR